jgi:Fur family transcriptional regulator, ferric uptake regulator
VGATHASASEAAVAALRAAGERITGPRRELLEALATTPGHPSADDLFQRLESRGSSTHRATVYRTLEFLVRAGVVAHVHLPHGAAAYHLVDERHRSHGHLACRGCERIFDIPGLLDGAAATARQHLGFVLDTDHVALSGWCPNCAPPPVASDA